MLWAREKGFQNLLETNGSLPEAFKKTAALADVVSMDMKLPSAVGRPLWNEHAEFLAVAPERTFVKVTLTKDSSFREFETMLGVLRKFPRVPLFLQPATGVHAGAVPIGSKKALVFLLVAKKRLADVRLSRQWHPIWGFR